MVLITLSSERHNGNSFEVIFPEPLIINPLGHKQPEIALAGANIWFSWHNISPLYDNNAIVYRDPDDKEHRINLPPGFYTLDLLDEYLRAIKAPIRISVNEITSRTIIKLPRGYKLDLNEGKINEILGFQRAVYIAEDANKRFEGTNPINITNGIDRLLIHCSIVDGSYLNSKSQIDSSDVIFSFAPEAPPGSLIVVNPNPELIYLPIRDTMIRRIKMEITDQNNNKINLNNEPVTYMLSLKY